MVDKTAEVIEVIEGVQAEEARIKALNQWGELKEQSEKALALKVQITELDRQIKELQAQYNLIEVQIKPSWEALATTPKPKTKSTFTFSKDGVTGEVTHVQRREVKDGEANIELVKLVLSHIGPPAYKDIKVGLTIVDAALKTGQLESKDVDPLFTTNETTSLTLKRATEKGDVPF